MKNVIKGFFLVFLSLLIGCSTTGGYYEEKTHFAFPNSNIIPLGHVKSTLSRWSVLILPVGEDDILLLLEEALKQKPGSDLVINYRIDTTITLFPIFIYKAEMVLEGTAAEMEVGEQRLRPIIKEINYEFPSSKL